MTQGPMLPPPPSFDDFRFDADAIPSWIAPAIALLSACRSEMEVNRVASGLPDRIVVEAVAFMGSRNVCDRSIMQHCIRHVGYERLAREIGVMRLQAMCKRLGVMLPKPTS